MRVRVGELHTFIKRHTNSQTPTINLRVLKVQMCTGVCESTAIMTFKSSCSRIGSDNKR